MLSTTIERLQKQYRFTPLGVVDLNRSTGITLQSVVSFTKTDDNWFHVIAKYDRSRVFSFHNESGETKSTVLDDAIVGQLYADGKSLYYSDINDNTVKRVNSQGESVVVGSGLNYPFGMAITSKGIFVTEYLNHSVALLHEGNVVRRFSGGGLKNPTGLVVDAEGALLVVSSGSDQILKYDMDGRLIMAFGHSGSGDNEFNTPFNIAWVGSDRLMVSDGKNKCIKIFTAEGNHIFSIYGFGDEELILPQAIVARSGKYSVCCSHSNKIFEFAL